MNKISMITGMPLLLMQKRHSFLFDNSPQIPGPDSTDIANAKKYA